MNEMLSEKGEAYFCAEALKANDHLNLGWLYLPRKDVRLEECDFPSPEKWVVKNDHLDEVSLTALGINGNILERLVVVSDGVFSKVVNDNLEVRTSVAIDPSTGAAEDGALFTYEAIPRMAVMWFDIVYSKPEYFSIRVKQNNGKNYDDQPIRHNHPSQQGWKWICDNVEKGLNLMEYLGIGGMNTRGMGRIKVLNKKSEEL